MAWTRASELERAVVCPGSTHLPRIVDNPGDAAQWGTMVHAWKETGKWPVDTIATRRRTAAFTVAGLSRDTLWPSGSGTHEVSYALSTERSVASKFLGSQEARDSWKTSHGDEWATGTADWVGDLFGDLWVDDMKTGKEVPADPWDLWQLRFYAACELLLSPEVEAARVSITHWPRYPADGVPRRIWGVRKGRDEVLDYVGVLEAARQATLRSRQMLAIGRQPLVNPGPVCTYCRAASACPAYN